MTTGKALAFSVGSAILLPVEYNPGDRCTALDSVLVSPDKRFGEGFIKDGQMVRTGYCDIGHQFGKAPDQWIFCDKRPERDLIFHLKFLLDIPLKFSFVNVYLIEQRRDIDTLLIGGLNKRIYTHP